MTTITLTGDENTLLARALKRLLANRGFAIVETDHGEGFEALTLDLTEEDAENLLALGTEPEKAPILTLDTPDVFGNKPDGNLIGRRFRHAGNGKVYEIKGFAWMGEDDVWGFRHLEVGNPTPITLVRPLSHLTGNRADGTPRYEEVATPEMRHPDIPIETLEGIHKALLHSKPNYGAIEGHNNALAAVDALIRLKTGVAPRGVAVEDSPFWSPQVREAARSNYMDAYGTALGWKE